MADTIRAITELLREVTKMAGGRIRGQIAFWVIFVLVAAICTWPAYRNVSVLLQSLNITIPPSFGSSLLITLAFSLVSVVLLAAIGFGIGAVISAILILFLGDRVQTATDDILSELRSVIDNARDLKTDAQTHTELEALSTKLQEIQAKQDRRLASRIVRWSRRRGGKRKDGR